MWSPATEATGRSLKREIGMSSGEINRKALREIYPSLTVGCFMKKPMTMDYLLKRIRSELD